MAVVASVSNTTWRSTYAAAIALALLAGRVSVAQAQAPARPAELELTLHVCRSGPAVATGHAERSAGAAELGAIEPAQNPSLVAQHQQTLDGPSERETVIGAEFPVPWSGRRGVMREAARERQRAAQARASADDLSTALDFRQAYTVAVVEHERLRIMAAHQTSLQDLSTALAQLVARGETASYDVRRHQSEVRLHARALASVKARAQRAARRLAYWLGGPPDAALLTSNSLSRAPLASGERTSSPAVLALRAEARAAALESDAAGRRWVPEPELFAGYRQVASGDATGHGVSLGITLPLTVFERGQGAAARARAERTLFEARAARLARELETERRAADESLQALEAALREAEQIEVETERLKESARVLYGAGEASITELLDAYRTGENAALDRLSALEELFAARLSVMRAAGKQFDAVLDASCGSRQGSGR
jgi:cobalt-zinc-cadmium efflux system outer membrane protein